MNREPAQQETPAPSAEGREGELRRSRDELEAEIERLRTALAESIDLTTQVRNDVSKKLEGLREVLWTTGLSRNSAVAATLTPKGPTP